MLVLGASYAYVVASLTLCHTSSKDAEHFLFRRVLIKLECGNEDTRPLSQSPEANSQI